jgi:hypothetical protein
MAVKKFCLLTLPAIVAVLLVVEAWVRFTWDETRGTPALYISDPVLVQRFAPHYSGWFAGVPIRINNLGMRDPRDYAIEKQPNTFRILLLGDSVAFGHGSIYEHTYAHLLEQRLKTWRPDVDWQIWNAGVPGYNSSQELAYLERAGPVYKPDLVIVGFHPNDVTSNEIVRHPSIRAVVAAHVKNWVKQTCYSYEFYRRLYLNVTWRLFASASSRRLLENLDSEDELLKNRGDVQNLPEQQITDVVPVTNTPKPGDGCIAKGDGTAAVAEFDREPQAARWRDAIAELQALHAKRAYNLMFFVSMAPDVCSSNDFFYDGGSRAWNDYFVRQLSKTGVPTVSTYDAFARYRPSQMPQAEAHALGNANRVKADLLFEFLRDRVLPR